jgi:predicted negative regulator of RcsB-dependent stress response
MMLLIGALIMGLVVWLGWTAWNSRDSWQASLVIGLFLLSAALNALVFTGGALTAGD